MGVIGTESTVASGAYRRALRSLRPDVEVVARACPLFVPLAEEGWWDHPVTREVAALYLEPFTGGRVDTLILGCTHYPLLRPAIAAAVGDGVHLVDSAEAVAAEVAERWWRAAAWPGAAAGACACSSPTPPRASTASPA